MTTIIGCKKHQFLLPWNKNNLHLIQLLNEFIKPRGNTLIYLAMQHFMVGSSFSLS